MADIKMFRFFSIHKEPSEYIFKKTNRLTNKAKAILKKYSNMKYYNETCKRKDYIYYLIYVDNNYAGFIEFEARRYYKQLYIKYIFLNEEYRGNGYSKLLFNFAINDLKENFKNIRTISAVPAFMAGKYFMESVGFIPDVYYCSSGGKGVYSIYYLYEKDIFVLDQEEYEDLCGSKYNYKLCGVKRYMKLIEQEREKDPDFSYKNYRYYWANLKKSRKLAKRRKQTQYDNLLSNTISDAPDFDDFFEIQEEKVVPSMFSKEYLDTYMDNFE